MKANLSVLLLLIASFQAHSGVLVMSDESVKLGHVSTDGDKLTVLEKATNRKTVYPKDQVQWFSTDKTVTSRYHAAVIAYRQKRYTVCSVLLDATIKNEPENKNRAIKAMKTVSAKLAAEKEAGQKKAPAAKIVWEKGSEAVKERLKTIRIPKLSLEKSGMDTIQFLYVEALKHSGEIERPRFLVMWDLQVSDRPQKDSSLSKEIRLDEKDIALLDAIKLICEKTGVNCSVGKIVMFYDDTIQPGKPILKLYQRVARNVLPKKGTTAKELRAFFIKKGVPFRSFTGGEARVNYDSGTETLMVSNSEENLKKMDKVVQGLKK